MTLGPVRRVVLVAHRAMEQLVARRRSQQRNQPDGHQHPLRGGNSTSRPAFDGILRDAREPGELTSRYPGGAQLCLQQDRCIGAGLGRRRGNVAGLYARDRGLYGVEHCQRC